jgi:hypothetical protein
LEEEGARGVPFNPKVYFYFVSTCWMLFSGLWSSTFAFVAGPIEQTSYSTGHHLHRFHFGVLENFQKF